MSEDKVAKIGMRNHFYRDSYPKVLFVLLLSVTINFGLTSTLVYMILNPPKPTFFATSISGRITPLFPLNEPNQSDSAVLQWANQAALASFTYNFVNYKQELQAASGYFTETGWGQFISALRDSNSLETVREKKLIVSAVATRAPIILQKGPLLGRYAWRVQMPLLVTYQSASEFQQVRNVVTLLITRVSTLNSVRGIGISQFIVGPSGGDIGQ
jgi:intracellular multiplication protein IcmL